MIDYKPTLKQELEKSGLPVYYELFVDSSTNTPCITYIESNNSSYLEGDNLLYSNLSYNIKVWGNDLATLIPIVDKIGDIMRKQGFTRVSYNELSFNSQLELIMIYSAVGWERN